jgi:tryptophan synthase alpha chain
MSRIEKAFSRRKALIPYITLGYPSPETALEVVPLLEEWGADIVELGIPFSDPLADGVTIQEASFQALSGGMNPGLALEIASRLRGKVALPLVFMSYYNPVFRFGLSAFCRACAESGVEGLIVPDLPPEEGEDLGHACEKNGLDLVYLLAPNSDKSRIRLVAERSRGFIYLVSLTGVTGPREALPPGLEAFVKRVRKETSLPLAVGFGIAGLEQAKRVALVADGVIVGSRLIQLIRQDPGLNKLGKFVQGLRASLDLT